MTAAAVPAHVRGRLLACAAVAGPTAMLAGSLGTVRGLVRRAAGSG